MFMRQDDINPIMAKSFLLENWERYDLADSKEQFLALLNILQAVGESIDSLFSAYANRHRTFADIFNDSWESPRAIAKSLMEAARFFTDEEFIDFILSRREDYVEYPGEWSDEIALEASDDPEKFSDVQIIRTEDGLVRRVWC